MPLEKLSNIANTQTVVFDLNSLDEDHAIGASNWELFQETIRILSDRDYVVFLVSDDPAHVPLWEGNKQVKVLGLSQNEHETLLGNDVLLKPTCFWVTEDHAIQDFLAQQKLWFACRHQSESHPYSIEYQQIVDVLRILDPSLHTSMHLAQSIFASKRGQSDAPYVVSVEGPEECGHAYFIEALLGQLENEEFVVQGLDLTSLMAPESSDGWLSQEARDWVLNDVLIPFSEGQRVLIEEPPAFLKDQEVAIFPLFLAPEMILMLWGSAMLTTEIQEYTDWGVLLELSPKAAAARMFGLDDREDFEPKFIEQYQEKDGKLYSDFLQKHAVHDSVESFINFDNFNAFRLKEESSS